MLCFYINYVITFFIVYNVERSFQMHKFSTDLKYQYHYIIL